MKIRAVANVGEDMLFAGERPLAYPCRPFAAHVAECCGIAIHPDGHIVAAYARHRARAFGHLCRGVVRAARTEPGLALDGDGWPGQQIGRASCRERVCQYV